MKDIAKIWLWILVITNLIAAVLWVIAGWVNPEQAPFSLVGEHLNKLVFEAAVCFALIAILNKK